MPRPSNSRRLRADARRSRRTGRGRAAGRRSTTRSARPVPAAACAESRRPRCALTVRARGDQQVLQCGAERDHHAAPVRIVDRERASDRRSVGWSCPRPRSATAGSSTGSGPAPPRRSSRTTCRSHRWVARWATPTAAGSRTSDRRASPTRDGANREGRRRSRRRGSEGVAGSAVGRVVVPGPTRRSGASAVPSRPSRLIKMGEIVNPGSGNPPDANRLAIRVARARPRRRDAGRCTARGGLRARSAKLVVPSLTSGLESSSLPALARRASPPSWSCAP